MSGKFEFGEEDHTALLMRAWELALHLLASKVNSAAFGYIQPIQPLSYVGNVITLGVANAFFRDRLEKNHSNAIRSALEFHLDTPGLQIVLIVMSRDQQRNAENRRQRSRTSSQPALPLEDNEVQTRRTGDSDGSAADQWPDESGTEGMARRKEREATIAHTQQRPTTGPRPIPNGQNPLAQPPYLADVDGYTGALPYSDLDLRPEEGGQEKRQSDRPNSGYIGAPNARTENASNDTPISPIAGHVIVNRRVPDGSASSDRARASNSSVNGLSGSSAPGSSRANTTKSKGTEKGSRAGSPLVPCLPLNDRYLFDNFLVGRSNRLAHAGATGVAERPGEVYNPLFLYGGPGLGKTHLMQGIAHAIRRQRPDTRIAYVSGEYFAQQYITAIREHATEDFRRQYREVDVWLVDDIQFVAGKEHTKEEFFHTFNTLYQGGKQIVIASDRSPRELNTMDERLRSRFQSGLIADISAPDLETRIAILHQFRLREGFNVENEVLEYIASAIQSNIRALEGALTKLIACSSIHKTAATAELAQSVLSEYFIDKPIRVRKVSLDAVVEAVAEVFGVAPTAIKGPNRNKDVSLARQVAMYLGRELLPEMNTTDLGTAFGNRDHATIIYSSQRVRGLMEMDPELKTLVSQLQKKLLTQ